MAHNDDLRPLLPLIFAIAVCSACGPAPIEGSAREYIRLAVALGERDTDSIDFYYGPPELVAGIRKNPPRLNDIRQSALQLADELKREPGPRGSRLAWQVRAIAARAEELLGSPKTFDQRTFDYFGVAVPESRPEEFDSVRTEISHLLQGRGALAKRYASFDQKFLVSGDRLSVVMARAIRGCREQTRNHLRLPSGERVDIEYVHDKPWSAYSRYQGNFHSVIQVNADLALTVDRVLQLACHEAYPGHHTQNVMQDIQFVRDSHWQEWTVQPTFSPQSLISEALATLGAEIAFPGQERVRFERDALFPLAGLDPAEAEQYNRMERLVDRLASAEPAIARDFLDGKLEWARAAAALEQQVLMEHPEQTLKYISEYRTYMITYTLGRDLVAKQVQNWTQFGQLLTDPNAATRIIMKK